MHSLHLGRVSVQDAPGGTPGRDGRDGRGGRAGTGGTARVGSGIGRQRDAHSKGLAYRLIPVEPFQLDANGGYQPSRFGFELLINQRVQGCPVWRRYPQELPSGATGWNSPDSAGRRLDQSVPHRRKWGGWL